MPGRKTTDESDQIESADTAVHRMGGHRRIKMSLSLIVGAGFGAFVGIAIALVLGLSVTANFTNTFSLLNDKAILTSEAMERQLRTQFSSMRNAVVAIKPFLDNGDMGFENPEETFQDLTMSLIANRTLVVLVLTNADGKRLGVYLEPDGMVSSFTEDVPISDESIYVVPNIRADSPPRWGPLVQNEFGLFVNVSVPFLRDGKLAGTLTAATDLSNLASKIEHLDDGGDSTLFIITGDDEVILHSDLRSTQTGHTLTAELPARRQVLGDPVLDAMADEDLLQAFDAAQDRGILVSAVDYNDEEFIMIRTRISGFSEAPWIVGQYIRGATISREVRRLIGSAAVGAGAMVVAILVAVWLGRRVAGPLKAIARQSERVGTLSLKDVEPLPRSRVAELDQVALAFNAMVEGLKAMNTYVPRSLFTKLMELGGSGAAEAREAELTVLFTDIVGFTAASEQMTARETAQNLNDHFAILVEAVEAEGGTVDKFIGDGMLAFWGAPDDRPDHAQAAIRAARRIAVTLQEVNRNAVASGANPYRMRIGIHTGTAVVGNVGALDRWNYTVVGDTVNAADRIQSLGRDVPGKPEVVILASAETVAHLGFEPAVSPVGHHNLRGRSGPMEVYRIDPYSVPSECEAADRSSSGTAA